MNVTTLLNLQTTSGLTFFFNGVISLPDAMSCDKHTLTLHAGKFSSTAVSN